MNDESALILHSSNQKFLVGHMFWVEREKKFDWSNRNAHGISIVGRCEQSRQNVCCFQLRFSANFIDIRNTRNWRCRESVPLVKKLFTWVKRKRLLGTGTILCVWSAKNVAVSSPLEVMLSGKDSHIAISHATRQSLVPRVLVTAVRQSHTSIEVRFSYRY